MKRLEESCWKISYVVIRKSQWQPLKFFTLKSEAFHSWIHSSVVLDLRSRYVRKFSILLQDFKIATKPASLLYSTNTRKYWDWKASVRYLLFNQQNGDLLWQSSTVWVQLDNSFLRYFISKKMYLTRTDDWHTAWINPRVPSLGVNTERDIHPVVSSFRLTYKADKKKGSCYLGTGRALFTHKGTCRSLL